MSICRVFGPMFVIPEIIIFCALQEASENCPDICLADMGWPLWHPHGTFLV